MLAVLNDSWSCINSVEVPLLLLQIKCLWKKTRLEKPEQQPLRLLLSILSFIARIASSSNFYINPKAKWVVHNKRDRELTALLYCLGRVPKLWELVRPKSIVLYTSFESTLGTLLFLSYNSIAVRPPVFRCSIQELYGGYGRIATFRSRTSRWIIFRR